MVEHIAELVSAFQRGPDDRTAFDRAGGKLMKTSLAEFAEKVYCRIGGSLVEPGHYIGS